MLEVCSGVTNEREREMRCPVGPVGRAEIDKSYAMNEVSKRMLEGLRSIDLTNLNLKKSTWVNSPVFRGSTSPFIEEGDGFTSEREREYGRF